MSLPDDNSIYLAQILIPHPISPILVSRSSIVGVLQQEIVWTKDIADQITDDSHQGIKGSTNPATVSFSNLSEEPAAILTINLPDADLSQVHVQIDGKLDDATVFTGVQVGLASTFNVHLIPKNPDEPFAYAGDVVWTVTVVTTGQTIQLGTSRLEIYAISPDTRKAVFFKKDNIPLILLRRIVYPAKPGYIKYLVDTLSHDFGFVYNSWGGANHLHITGTGGSYYFGDWLENRPSALYYVNCYDMAAIVQTCLPFLLGDVKGTWAYQEPFGYINTIKLIGWRDCNNPFFMSSDNFHELVVDINQTDPLPRSGFRTHAFIVLKESGNVIDACANQAGTQTFAEYITNTVDTKTTLYGVLPSPSAPAKPDDMESALDGATGVESIYTFAFDSTETLGLHGTTQSIMEQARTSNAPLITHSNTHLYSLAQSTLDNISQCTSTSEPEVLVLSNASRISWRTQLGPEAFLLFVIIVLDDHDIAYNAMIHHLTSSQHGPQQLYRDDAGPFGQYALETLDGREQAWVRGNLFTTVQYIPYPDAPKESGEDARTIVASAAKHVDERLKENSVDKEDWIMAQVDPVEGAPSSPIHVGERFEVTTSVIGATRCYVDTPNQHVVCHNHADPDTSKGEARKLTFQFIAKLVGKETVRLAFMHFHTQSLFLRQFEVEVVA